MSNKQMAQLEGLMEELDLIKNARRPEDCARDIRDWVDAHALDDQLTRTSEWMNPWVPDKEQKGKKKRKD